MSLLAPCALDRSPVAAVGIRALRHRLGQARPRWGQLVSVYRSGLSGLRLTKSSVDPYWSSARALFPQLPARARRIYEATLETGMPVHGVGRFRLAAEFAARQTGPVVFAGDYLSTATVEGALSAGRRAAIALRTGAIDAEGLGG